MKRSGIGTSKPPTPSTAMLHRGYAEELQKSLFGGTRLQNLSFSAGKSSLCRTLPSIAVNLKQKSNTVRNIFHSDHFPKARNLVNGEPRPSMALNSLRDTSALPNTKQQTCHSKKQSVSYCYCFWTQSKPYRHCMHCNFSMKNQQTGLFQSWRHTSSGSLRV